MAKKTSHLKRFKFTKADAVACKRYKGNRSAFGKCMAGQVKRRMKRDGA